jgi:hypothetical protein
LPRSGCLKTIDEDDVTHVRERCSPSPNDWLDDEEGELTLESVQIAVRLKRVHKLFNYFAMARMRCMPDVHQHRTANESAAYAR